MNDMKMIINCNFEMFARKALNIYADVFQKIKLICIAKNKLK